jgi:hypothetical protein
LSGPSSPCVASSIRYPPKRYGYLVHRVNVKHFVQPMNIELDLRNILMRNGKLLLAGERWARPLGRATDRGLARANGLLQDQILRPTAHQNGTASEKRISRNPADSIIVLICARVMRCSRRVPNRSSASVRML